jgi:TonB family protein
MRAPVEVEVRLSVSEEGKVSNARYGTQGPGNYFARTARQAAQSWTFQPPRIEGEPQPSEWMILFRFDRSHTEMTATEVH